MTIHIIIEDIEHYHEAVDKFISVMDNLAKQVEQEKRNGIIVSNKLASLSNKFKEDLAVLQVINYYTCSVNKKITGTYYLTEN